ncbi:hypothetical protein [uncultured Aliiroseovarius sp.]|uniref:hypothetical protein n=1 Tax=uncultured Aliiroseovarius sp. TaxID=1658783 RepID=UPI0025975D07|nr:hypothetical protein [uncultured Aliiroseovarius sp.]MCI2399504.1 hypothetical protein [Aliiroseovarius subalbicans]
MKSVAGWVITKIIFCLPRWWVTVLRLNPWKRLTFLTPPDSAYGAGQNVDEIKFLLQYMGVIHGQLTAQMNGF